jgi:hypothetical protein
MIIEYPPRPTEPEYTGEFSHYAEQYCKHSAIPDLRANAYVASCFSSAFHNLLSCLSLVVPIGACVGIAYGVVMTRVLHFLPRIGIRILLVIACLVGATLGVALLTVWRQRWKWKDGFSTHLWGLVLSPSRETDLPTANQLREAVRLYKEHQVRRSEYQESLHVWKDDCDRCNAQAQKAFSIRLRDNAREILGQHAPEPDARVQALLWLVDRNLSEDAIEQGKTQGLKHLTLDEAAAWLGNHYGDNMRDWYKEHNDQDSRPREICCTSGDERWTNYSQLCRVGSQTFLQGDHGSWTGKD